MVIGMQNLFQVSGLLELQQSFNKVDPEYYILT